MGDLSNWSALGDRSLSIYLIEKSYQAKSHPSIRVSRLVVPNFPTLSYDEKVLKGPEQR